MHINIFNFLAYLDSRMIMSLFASHLTDGKHLLIHKLELVPRGHFYKDRRLVLKVKSVTVTHGLPVVFKYWRCHIIKTILCFQTAQYT